MHSCYLNPEVPEKLENLRDIKDRFTEVLWSQVKIGDLIVIEDGE